MSLFSQLKRLALVFPDALIGGPAYAQHWYLTRSLDTLDGQRVWQQLTQPEPPIIKWISDHYPPAPIRQFLLNMHVAIQDRLAGVAQHYDVSNDFYRLFLDERYMFYTCADFVHSTDTLETAQENKANYLLNLIDPQPQDQILDLGCGWGSMMKKIYATTGNADNLTGYTLSKEQIRFIQATTRFQVEYKDLVTAQYAPNSFDKIYSIGMVEHVPVDQLLSLFERLANALKPTGRMVHHFFCQLSAAPATRFLAAGAQMFPGAELTTLRHHLQVFDQANLSIVHHSIHDYRPTLQAWYERLGEHREEAVRLVGVQTYNRYLCYLADAWRLFSDRDLILNRFVLQRQDAPIRLRATVTCEDSPSVLQPREQVASWRT